MPYDPRMLQMAQQGVRMMSPDQRNAFADPRSQQPQQPKQWWEQAVQYGQPANRPVNMPDDRTDEQRKQPPSLYDMMLNLGRMSRPQYDQAVKGTGPAAMVSPWAWLGSMGGGR